MRVRSAVVLAAAIVLPLPARAQPSGLVIDRDRLDHAPAAPPAAAAPPTASAPAAGASTALLTEVEVQGRGVPPDRLRAAWVPFVGRRLDAGTIRAVADAVAAAAKSAGVALYTVRVPPQGFEGGRLRLELLEGELEAVRVTGGSAGGRRLVERYARRLEAERPLRRATLERYVSLIRDIPGANPDISLLQGSKPTGVVLQVALKPRPVEFGLGASNRGSPLLDRQQLTGELVLNGVVSPGSQTRLAGVVSADLETLRYLALSHSLALGDQGLRLQGSVAALRTRLKRLPVAGRATTAGLQASYPVVRGYTRNLTVAAALDGVDSDNAVFGQVVTSERTRVVRASAAASRQSARTALAASAVLSGGLEGLGARVDPRLGEAGFVKLTARLGVDRVLARGLVLRLRLAGQAGGAALPASEQFALGGEPFGRGFDRATLIGDRGLAGSAELGWAPSWLPKPAAGSEAYVFCDAGRVWREARAFGPAVAEGLSSAGLGVRVKLASGLVLGLEAARPIDSPAGAAKRWRGALSLKSAL